MTSGSTGDERPTAPLEIPIEPLPSEPLVPRPDPSTAAADRIEPAPAVDAVDAAETIETPVVISEPTLAVPPVVVTEAVVDLPERDTAGRSVLRPTTLQPARDEPTRTRRSPSFTDRRRPIRAALGLVALVVLGAIALAAALAFALAAVALAIRETAS